MKTPKNTFSILSRLFIFCIFSSSIFQSANAELTIELLNQKVNGNPVPYEITCGGILSFATTDVYEADIRTQSNDNTKMVTFNCFTSPSTSALTFSEPLPFSGQGITLTHMTFYSSTEYYGSFRLFATDGTDNAYCDLAVDWPAPVELSSFVSAVNGNNVTLNWTTSSETNNGRFEIEKTSVINGQNNSWLRIGTVNGSGTTTLPKNYIFEERGLNSGTYNYRLKQIDLNGHFEYHNLINDVIVGVPLKFSLQQNYPNPFNPVTQIDFELPEEGNVNLSVYDLSGKLVSTLAYGQKTAGYYSISFDGSNLSSGLYFYRLQSGNINLVKKMTLIR